MIAGSRSGCQSGTSSGIPGAGRLATMTRIPAGGSAGSRAAMLCASEPTVTPRSSSSPSTSSTKHPPSCWQEVAASRIRSRKYASRVASGSMGGSSLPSSVASCSSTTSMNASRVSCAASRAVMKNDTMRTRSSTSAGGRATNVDISADFPAHGPACHHVYRVVPEPEASGIKQNRASSASSASRPVSSGGAIRRTCSRYAFGRSRAAPSQRTR